MIWSFEVNGAAENTVIKGMEDRELLMIATYFIANGGDQATLHQVAAQYLDATNLVRWQAAFTQAQVNPAVGAYSPPATSYAYFTHPALTKQIKGGGMPPPLPAPNPTTDMPIQQLYLEYRMQPGSSVLGSMSNALWWVATKTSIGKAGAGGWAAGSYFYKAMVWIDPDYGWDLVTTYGQVSVEFGTSIDFNPPGGAGVVTNPDGSVYDGYGNEIHGPGYDDPSLAGQTPTTEYGIPGGTPTTPYVSPPPYNPGQDLYNFWDNTGGCLLLLGCGGIP